MEGVVGEFLEIPTIPPKNERATKQSAPKNSPNTSGEKKAKSKEDTNKTKQFVEDKDNYEHNINPNARSKKAKQLSYERITEGIYLPGAKTLGFTTKRPLVWLQEFEPFFAHNPLLKCKWVNTKCPETKLFCETKIHVYSINVPYVTVHIFHSTATVLFKGSQHKLFTSKHFAPIHTICNNISPGSPEHNVTAPDRQQRYCRPDSL